MAIRTRIATVFQQWSVSWRDALIASIAGGVAWLICQWLLGQPKPIFAMVTGVICLAPNRPNHARQAVGVMVGVMTGVVIGELSLLLPDKIPLMLHMGAVSFVSMVVATTFAADAPATVKDAADVGPDDLILDIGPRTAAALADQLRRAGTIVWNGPVGVFEFDAFAGGTRAIAQAIAESDGFSIAGGGDTLAAIAKFGITDRVGYISTGGGAFLEFLEGKTLPAVAALQARGA